MGQLYIPAKNKIKGPWLIGQLELEELGTVFDNIESKLSEAFEKEIEYEANISFEKKDYDTLEICLAKTKARYENKKKTKRALLLSNNDTRLFDNTIKGVLKDKNIDSLKPKELVLRIEYGYHNEFMLKIDTAYDGELEYNLQCFSPEIQEDIVFEIEKWITKFYPNKGTQIWNQFTYWFGLLAIFSILFSGLNIVTYETTDVKSIYLKETKEILKTGITKENETKALEIILKYVSDYTPDKVTETRKINKIPLQIFCISIFILIITIFYPKTTIGVGRHKNRLRFYKVYTKIILISIPTIFILTPLIEWIKSILTH